MEKSKPIIHPIGTFVGYTIPGLLLLWVSYGTLSTLEDSLGSPSAYNLASFHHEKHHLKSALIQIFGAANTPFESVSKRRTVGDPNDWSGAFIFLKSYGQLVKLCCGSKQSFIALLISRKLIFPFHTFL